MWAHHSFAAEFDFQKPVTLKGTVVQWEMINPHGWITMDVAGGEITVEGYTAKDGSNTANAARITLPDGRKVFAGSSGTPAGTPTQQDK